MGELAQHHISVRGPLADKRLRDRSAIDTVRKESYEPWENRTPSMTEIWHTVSWASPFSTQVFCIAWF